MLSQKIRDKILKKCISLKKYGVNNFACNKEDAINLINTLIEDNEIGILGGDVCTLKSGYLEFIYDNWYSNPTEKESREEYYFRSKIESLKYIEKYPVKPEDNILFSITFTEQVHRLSTDIID